jgi:hypothetical protein
VKVQRSCWHFAGFIALELAKRFREVTGLDPAAKMVEVGLQPSESSQARHITYKVGSAEDLHSAGISDESVDLVTAGKGAQLLRLDLTRIRSGSSLVRSPKSMERAASHTQARWDRGLHRELAWWQSLLEAYAEMQLPSRPDLNHHITRLSSSPDALGPHWSQPGRSIVEGLLDQVPFPVQPTTPSLTALTGFPVPAEIDEPQSTGMSGWDSSTAVRIKTSSADSSSPWLMRKKLSWTNFGAYLRTWSALHSYHEDHPEDRALGKDGDIVGRVVGKLRQEFGDVEEVEVGWPLSVVMIKKERA